MHTVLRAGCLVLTLILLLTSCSMFRRTEPQQTPEQPTTDKKPTDNSTKPPEGPADHPIVNDPTPDELIADLPALDFASTVLTVAVDENCALFAQGTDSNAVLATVLEAIKKKYNGEAVFAEYTKNHLYLGVEEMVNQGSATSYFADLLILPATEYVRYRDAGLLERLETIPFLHTDAACFDQAMTDLFRDESGTYGVVGYGSQLFKNQITVFFNPELLEAAGIDFDGYAKVYDKSWSVQDLTALAAAYAEKTGKDAISSGLTEEMTARLLSALSEDGEQIELSMASYAEVGRFAFMMGRVPLFIGVLGDVEKMLTARDRYGMLPIPYLENGEYETFYDMDGVYVFCVPKGNNRTDCTGLFLQAYHTASQYLPYSYFQQFLLEKYVRDEGTLRMIALVGKSAKHLPAAEDETEE